MRTLTLGNKMMVAGHRGDCYNCFENTMKAFETGYIKDMTYEELLQLNAGYPEDCIKKLERIGAR